MPDFASTLVFNVISALVLALIGVITKTLLPYLKAKKDAATRLITDFFHQNGIELTTEQISTLIETAVQELNANIIEVPEAIGFDTGEVPVDDQRH